MNAFDVYRTYLAIKAHFCSESYDCSKYGTLMAKAKHETFERRSDRFFIDKISKKYSDSDIVGLMVSNFMENDDLWSRDLLDSSSEANYLAWRKRTESMEYNFTNDMDKIAEFLIENKISFPDIFLPKANRCYPDIVIMTMQKVITPETYAILDIILGFSDKLNRNFLMMSYGNCFIRSLPNTRSLLT